MAEFLAWKGGNPGYFGTPDPAAEAFHRPWSAEAGYQLVETWWHGFSVPEADLNGEIYHWTHPNLGVTSGGIWIFKGKKRTQIQAEHLNYLNYQPVPDDLTNCTFANGLSLKMLTEQQHWEITYADPAEGVSLDLTSRAIMPAAFRPVGGHFTQAVRITGELVLHGERFPIDGYSSRDRSWGDVRSEQRVDVPPPSWQVGVFGDDLAFHSMAFDSPELDPALARRYPNLAGGRNLLWGYLWKDGRLLGIKECRKKTTREPVDLFPTEVTMQLVDETDAVHEIHGEIRAHIPFCYWPNMTSIWALTRWTLDGRTGYGDTQEALYPPFVRENARAG